MLKNAARPHTCGDRVASMYTDGLTFQIFGTTDTGPRVVEDRAVVEDARRKNRDGREMLSVRLGAKIGRKCQLADIEFQTSHHAAECLDQNGNIFVFDLKTLGPD